MPSDASPVDGSPSPLDVGLLSPGTVGEDDSVSDAALLDALVAAEVALSRTWVAVGIAPDEAVIGLPSDATGIDPVALARAARSDGNPVIPLIGLLKERVPAAAAAWIHRGATSQDILDTALMLVSADATNRMSTRLHGVEVALERFIADAGDTVVAARTLTQHAVPTTVGLRAAGWRRSVIRARRRVDAVRAQLPAQLAGAGGTLAAFVELGGADAAARLPAAFAEQLGLTAPGGPWHTTRWPVTELGDAVVQAVDAVAKIGTDVANLSRTEIGELAEKSPGGSSAMPQKQNPVRAVLIRSAGMRAPQLGATLHLTAALATDERPDGAWHAEWPTLRELLRLGLGATANAVALVEGLVVDREAAARNLALTGGLIVSERLGIVLVPLIGRDRFDALIAAASGGGDLAALVRALPEARAQGPAEELDVDALLDPANYVGLAPELLDDDRPASGA